MHMINRQAFVDTITLSISGRRKKNIDHKTVLKLSNRSIAACGRMYARCLVCKHLLTGNEVQVRYGKLKPFDHVPEASVLFRSERHPLSGAQILLALGAIFRVGYRATVSRVEFTLDQDCYGLQQVVRQALTNAREMPERVDRRGRRTQYLGSPRSMWQMRIYEKGDGIVRLEFSLKRALLRRLGINSICAIARLRNLDLSSLVTFVEADPARLHAALPPRLGEERRDVVARIRWAVILRDVLRQEYRIDPSTIFRLSALGKLTAAMQCSFLW